MPVLVPAGSVAVINLTAVGAQAAGFFTAWPCGQPRPGTSNLNYEPGMVVAGAALVAPGAGGNVCVFTSAAVNLLFDVFTVMVS